MLFSPSGRKQTRRGGLVLSVTAHAGILALGLLALSSNQMRPVIHESRCCTAALYWTGATGTSHSAGHRVPRRKKRTKPSVIPAVSAAAASAPAAATRTSQPQTAVASPQQQPTLGTGSGSENAEPALPVYFPTPGVKDRSLLPPSEQNIVVDVSISAVGEVTDEKLVRGFGNALDQIVLETVKAWRFRPATLNGTAIASTEELVFPFGQNSPGSEG
jgi:TonB family protein